DVGLVGGAEPAALDEQVGQGRALAGAPGRAGLGELLRPDQVQLQGQHAEEQGAGRVHERPRQVNYGENEPYFWSAGFGGTSRSASSFLKSSRCRNEFRSGSFFSGATLAAFLKWPASRARVSSSSARAACCPAN